MAGKKCPECNGRGQGGSSEVGTAWVCFRCHGAGTVKPFKKIRREARIPMGPTFPDLPSVYDRDHGYVGDVASVFEDGVNVEHWDGKLWSFYQWSEVPNADEIKAAITAAATQTLAAS